MNATQSGGDAAHSLGQFGPRAASLCSTSPSAPMSALAKCWERFDADDAFSFTTVRCVCVNGAPAWVSSGPPGGRLPCPYWGERRTGSGSHQRHHATHATLVAPLPLLNLGVPRLEYFCNRGVCARILLTPAPCMCRGLHGHWLLNNRLMGGGTVGSVADLPTPCAPLPTQCHTHKKTPNTACDEACAAVAGGVPDGLPGARVAR
jgi:hypothetical protein